MPVRCDSVGWEKEMSAGNKYFGPRGGDQIEPRGQCLSNAGTFGCMWGTRNTALCAHGGQAKAMLWGADERTGFIDFRTGAMNHTTGFMDHRTATMEYHGPYNRRTGSMDHGTGPMRRRMDSMAHRRCPRDPRSRTMDYGTSSMVHGTHGTGFMDHRTSSKDHTNVQWTISHDLWATELVSWIVE